MKILTLLLFLTTLLLSAVDINTANVTELASLKKIGNKKAARIIAYRETKCFKSVDELRKVKGIKKKTLKKNKGNITASACKK